MRRGVSTRSGSDGVLSLPIADCELSIALLCCSNRQSKIGNRQWFDLSLPVLTS